jgi:hypothetical protein
MRPLTHAEAWRGQDDLDALCRERPLETHEIIGQNALYGNDLVIKAFAGVPADDALRIALPHGVELTRHLLNAPHRQSLARLPVVAYYAGDGVSHLRALGVRNLLWPMAAPFVYASRMSSDEIPGERRGTIFFPSHSTSTGRPAQDFAELADRVAALQDVHQPVTVCLYFADYLRGDHAPFRKLGLRVVSAGHAHDPQFLFRLRHLIVDHEFAASNDLGSSCYYAIHAGCKYFHVADELTAVRSDELGDPWSKAALARLQELGDRSYSEQRQEADWHLGAANLLSPEELRALLRRARQLDRWGVCVDRRARPVSITVSRPWRPWLMTRWLQAAVGTH